jgi:hypothetical protein
VQGAREHQELLGLRDKVAILEQEIETAINDAESKQRVHSMQVASLKLRNKTLKLEKNDAEVAQRMHQRQMERFKNSLNEIEIIVEQYNVLNKLD